VKTKTHASSDFHHHHHHLLRWRDDEFDIRSSHAWRVTTSCLCQPRRSVAGKVTAGLTSHWLCVTDFCGLTALVHSLRKYAVTQKNPDHYNILARLHQKSTNVGNCWQIQLHFISSQVAGLVPLRTTCSFHGNDSRYVWAPWADCEQTIVDKAIDQWRKRLRDFMKVNKGEHFEHLLWLAVAYCVLLVRRIVSNNWNISVIFVNTAFYEWRRLW